MSLADANDGYRIRPLRGRRLNPLGNACWPCIYSKYWTQTSINSVICINSRSQFITILCFCSHEFSNIFLRKYVTLRNFKLCQNYTMTGFWQFFSGEFTCVADCNHLLCSKLCATTRGWQICLDPYL